MVPSHRSRSTKQDDGDITGRWVSVWRPRLVARSRLEPCTGHVPWDWRSQGVPHGDRPWDLRESDIYKEFTKDLLISSAPGQKKQVILVQNLIIGER